jgi:hypothetical protein
MKIKVALFFILFSLIPAANSQESEAFNQMKKMLGTWEGSISVSDGTVLETTSEFKLISGGSTIIENVVEDGVEMATTYSDKDGELVVKHYCALGTEPIFEALSVSRSGLSLTLISNTGYTEGQDDFVTSITYQNMQSNPDSVIVLSTVSQQAGAVSRRAMLSRVQ